MYVFQNGKNLSISILIYNWIVKLDVVQTTFQARIFACNVLQFVNQLKQSSPRNYNALGFYMRLENFYTRIIQNVDRYAGLKVKRSKSSRHSLWIIFTAPRYYICVYTYLCINADLYIYTNTYTYNIRIYVWRYAHWYFGECLTVSVSERAFISGVRFSGHKTRRRDACFARIANQMRSSEARGRCVYKSSPNC